MEQNLNAICSQVSFYSTGVVLTWHFNQLSDHKLVKFYRVFAKEENSDWIKLGEVESLRLPMGCRLSISDAGKRSVT